MANQTTALKKVVVGNGWIALKSASRVSYKTYQRKQRHGKDGDSVCLCFKEAADVLEENRSNLSAEKKSHRAVLCLRHRSHLVFTADLDTGRSTAE